MLLRLVSNSWVQAILPARSPKGWDYRSGPLHRADISEFIQSFSHTKAIPLVVLINPTRKNLRERKVSIIISIEQRDECSYLKRDERWGKGKKKGEEEGGEEEREGKRGKEGRRGGREKGWRTGREQWMVVMNTQPQIQLTRAWIQANPSQRPGLRPLNTVRVTPLRVNKNTQLRPSPSPKISEKVTLGHGTHFHGDLHEGWRSLRIGDKIYEGGTHPLVPQEESLNAFK